MLLPDRQPQSRFRGRRGLAQLARRRKEGVIGRSSVRDPRDSVPGCIGVGRCRGNHQPQQIQQRIDGWSLGWRFLYMCAIGRQRRQAEQRGEQRQ